MIYLSRWLADHLGFLPFLRVGTDAAPGTWDQTRYTSSAFIAGVVVAMMVLPVTASIMREVFAALSAAPCSASAGHSARPSPWC